MLIPSTSWDRIGDTPALVLVVFLFVVGFLLLGLEVLLLLGVMEPDKVLEPADPLLTIYLTQPKQLNTFKEFLSTQLQNVSKGGSEFLVCQQMLVIANTYYKVGLDFQTRNIYEKDRVDQAQRIFLAGVVCIVLALLTMVYTAATGAGVSA